MMYPRLRIARDLLAEDGLLLVSTDETESDNLKQICNEIFGEENFVERVVWKNKYGSGALTKGFANVHEYVTIYSRTPMVDLAAPLNDEQRKEYRLIDDKLSVRGGFLTQPLATTSKDPRPNLVYPLVHNGREIWPDKQWIWSRDRLEAAYRNGELVITETDGVFSVRSKQYLRDENGIERLGKPLSLMNGPFNQEGTKDIARLFGKKVFSFPKPVDLIRLFVSLVAAGDTSGQGLYVDFFAGSGTTGHAVMAQNAADGGARRYLLVQLPEQLDESSPDQRTAAEFCKSIGRPSTIAELAKERLRRAAKEIRTQDSMFAGDLGFRVFKLAESNIAAWNHQPDNLARALDLGVMNVRDGRSASDLLIELVIRLGIPLSAPITVRQIAGHTVSTVGGGALMTCLDGSMTSDDVDALAEAIVSWHRELAPADPHATSIVVRDSAFADDVAKTNFAAILQQHGFASKNIRSV